MRNIINLTKTERLIVANQNRILAALYPDQAEGYKHRAEVLENGYTWFYGNVFQEIYDELDAGGVRVCHGCDGDVLAAAGEQRQTEDRAP